MRLERTKNAARNAAFGYLSRLILLFFPFITRSVFLRVLDSEYLGLNGLFSSILMVLNMSELGFGSAIVVHMYRAIAADDGKTINALLNYYRKVYHIVGTVILCAGCAVIPFLPRLIRGSYPADINLTAVYLVFLFDTCASYFLFAYYSSLISAFQRDDLLTKVNLAAKVLMYIGQIAMLLTVNNYYAYLAIMPAFTIARNVFVYFTARKYFPEYKPYGSIAPKIKSDISTKIKGAIIGKVSGACRNSLDSIFVSMFLGLSATAIYGNYYYIMDTIAALLMILPLAAMGGIGNSVALESQEKNFCDLMRMNFLYMWLSGWCAICMLCLYQPFMKLWVGGDMLLPASTMVLFCVYLYILRIETTLGLYSETLGLYWERRYITIAEAVGNITLNYFLGKHFGIAGILWATIITVLGINFLWGCRVVFRHYFTHFSANQYILWHLKRGAVTLTVGAVTYWACSFVTLSGIPGLIVTGLICVVLPNLLFFLIYRKTPSYQEAVPWVLEKAKLIRFSH